jgi:hypothetical protein
MFDLQNKQKGNTNNIVAEDMKDIIALKKLMNVLMKIFMIKINLRNIEMKD